ncbi:MAG: endonuclease/exonuclease/phosphatase family protein [Pirellulales bacterium]
MRTLNIAVLGLALVAAAKGISADEIVRVMTFNIRYGTADDGESSWDKRKELLVDTIRNFDPDLLGTQEVLAMQVDFLVEHLEDYTLVGVGRNDGKRRGEFAAALFKSRRFEPIDSGNFWLSETPETPGSKSWDSSLPRIVTWVKLRDRQADGKEIYFVNTHWDHRGQVARVESGKLIRKWLSEHARGTSVIMTGDLNVTDSHEGFRALVSDEGEPRLADVYRQVHPEPHPEEASSHGFSGRKNGRRIDFILATPDWKASEATIDRTNRDGRYPSDHYPVTAVLHANRK